MIDLSVVIATTDARRTIDSCLRRLAIACASLKAEFIVVDASTDGTADRVARVAEPPVTLLRLSAGTLTPQLWATGCRISTGRYVAFTTGHCLVASGWAEALTAALDQGAAGAGGPLVQAAGISALDRAVYYLRYSAFMPHTLGDGRIAGELAGDNAMYARHWLDRRADLLANGFWEVDFHRAVRAEKGWLAAAQTAQAEFGPAFPATTILRHRFAHGSHFGFGRVRSGSRRWWQVVVATPLVPLVLATRIARRVMPLAEERWGFCTALPWLLLLATAWAAGEAHGALATRKRR